LHFVGRSVVNNFARQDRRHGAGVGPPALDTRSSYEIAIHSGVRKCLAQISPSRHIFSRSTPLTSITSLGKTLSNYVNRTCNTSSRLLQPPYIVPAQAIPSVSISFRNMSDQSNIPENPEDLKWGNLFDVKGFVAVLTGVRCSNEALNIRLEPELD